MRKMELGKMRNLSQIVPFFSDFSPISNQFHTFSVHFLECIFGNFSQLPTFPIPPPIPPPSPPPFPPMLPPFLRFPHFPEPLRLIRLRLARMRVTALQVFSAMLRMSYRERLVDVIPAVFHKFIPEAPKHFFKWDAKRWRDKEPPKYKQVAEAVYTVISSGQYESEEVLLELDRLDWNNEMTLPDKVEVLTHCILVNGIETISHQYQMLEKLKPALEGIIDSAEKGGGDQLVDMQLRLKLIQCCCAFWDNSPQHKVQAPRPVPCWCLDVSRGSTVVHIRRW